MRIQRPGESLQLSLLLPLTTATGDTKRLRLLVDTGAEINLIRDRLVPMAPAPIVLSFASASGAPMAGASRVAKLGLERKDQDPAEEYLLTANLRNADIKVDMILSYPCLKDHNIGVLPHRTAFIMEKSIGDHLLLSDAHARQNLEGPPVEEMDISINHVSSLAWDQPWRGASGDGTSSVSPPCPSTESSSTSEPTLGYFAVNSLGHI